MNEKLSRTLEALNRRGFHAQGFATAAQMRQAALALVKPGQSVGFGGSVTVQDLGIYEELCRQGHPVHWHWHADAAARKQTLLDAFLADVYFMSANALTETGRFWNIDGNGNRLACLLSGPETVIMLLGSNKLVPDDEAALRRIKTVACPQNARRLGLKTPCAAQDACFDCAVGDRMCQFTLLTEHPPKGRAFHVLIADEPLGY